MIEDCASGGMGNLQKIPRKNQEENQDSITACTTQKKIKNTFNEAGPSMSNAAANLETMESVLQHQYHGKHGSGDSEIAIDGEFMEKTRGEEKTVKGPD